MLFSIIIPVFNRGYLVSETIESVLNQNFSSYEIIVVNDGSSDDTLGVLNRYQSSICIINQEHQGAEIAKNTGVKYASGDYLVFLDSDDILLSGALSIYEKIIRNENQPALIFAKGYGFDAETNISNSLYKNKTCNYSLNKDFFSKREPVWLSTSFLVVNRALWNSNISFKRGTFPADDLDFLLRNGTLSPCIIIKGPSTVGYRYHDNNSVINILRIIDSLNYLLRLERKREYPGGLKRKVDRLALLGGHVLIWSLRGLKKQYYMKPLQLFFKGIPAVIAKAVVKSRNLFMQKNIRCVKIL